MPWVKESDCIKCKVCVNVCPVEGAITLKDDGYPYINNDICTRCGLCMEKCPKNAIRPNYENPSLRGMGGGRGGFGRGMGRGMGRGFGRNRGF
ncbi:4Fe-4S binding protein [Thermosipho globiformans]|uniref:4Fe-4S binding protein n=1 Tax=Thermosipho globiformans TaxID=380685 RepID=UPI000F8F3051|nr:4Fe-4S binding protein [Thermosipho globiformans]